MLRGAGRPQAGRMNAGDKKFKDYVKRMVADEGFRPVEDSEHRWYVDSEHSDEVYETLASGKSAYCSCRSFKAAHGDGCRRIGRIRPVLGIFGFAPTKEAALRSPAAGCVRGGILRLRRALCRIQPRIDGIEHAGRPHYDPLQVLRRNGQRRDQHDHVA